MRSISLIAHALVATSLSTGALAEGAVAFGMTRRAVAVAIRVDLPTPETAASDALSACNSMAASEKSGVTCRVVSKFKRLCAAYARGASSAAWIVAKNQPDAERQALAMCGAKSGNCKVLINLCDVRD